VGWSHYSLGYVLSHLGLHEKALEQYRETVKSYEKAYPPYNLFGIALGQVGEELV
jgi:hypothetical protein